MKARVVLPGAARGAVLRLDEALSFWGGVDPETGRLTDPHGARRGESIAGKILVVPETRGSSSSSAVMLELLMNGHAPEALVVGRVDAILGLGILVAREMGWRTIPLLELAASDQALLRDGAVVDIGADGDIRETGA